MIDDERARCLVRRASDAVQSIEIQAIENRAMDSFLQLVVMRLRLTLIDRRADILHRCQCAIINSNVR